MRRHTPLNILLSLFLLLNSTSLGVAQPPDTVDKDYSAELPRIAPLSPEDSAKQFEIADGFDVKLVAAEPLVFYPVALAFENKGQLRVVEMCDYSEQDKERLGKVVVLRDENHDGVMDSRKVFVEGLSWPTALFPWLDGVIVADAPNLTFHRDTNGDLKADKIESWFVGFGRTNVQGLINSFRWGVDGWIHGATSSSGAELQAEDGTKIALGRRDFAIDPISHKLRPESGGGQHGMYFNRWGDKFVTSNSDHLQQIVDIESWLASQASPVAMPSVRKSIAEDGPQAEVYRVSSVEPWRIVRTRLRMSGVAPGVVEGGGRAAGYFTGATGTCIMDVQRGFGLAGEPYDTAIVCDVGSNLVHRKRVIDHGFFFTAQRLDSQTEMLRSKDIWFRPVQIGEGPDGGLYIADMYREVIEHPASLPPMIKKHLDLTSGRDKGRIWRLARKNDSMRGFADLSKSTDAELVSLLGSDIAHERTRASQAIVERHATGKLGSSTVGALESAALTASAPEARLLSLNLLNRIGKLSQQTAAKSLSEKHPRVLAAAIEHVGQNGLSEKLASTLKSIATSTVDNRVQFALAKLASQLSAANRDELLAQLLTKDSDPLVRAVVATAAGKDSWKLLMTTESTRLSDDNYSQYLVLWLPLWTEQLSKDAHLANFVVQSMATSSPRQSAWLSALARLNSSAQVSGILRQANAQSIVDQVVSDRLDQSATVELAKWLRLTTPELQQKWMSKLLNKSVPEAIQSSCIDSLSWANHPALTQTLVDNFKSLTPSLQSQALRAMTSRADRQQQLLEALKQQKIARSQIPADIRQSLTAQKDKSVAEQFKSLLNQASSDRAAVLEKYVSSLDKITASADAAKRGKEVFTKVCAQCHKLGEIGNDVGPPLKQLGDKSPTQLLESILDPSREVDPKYMGYTFLLEDGSVLTGIIVQESGSQIVIGEAGGKQTTLDRSAIEELKSSGLSLMPNGIEEQINPAQMSDLIQFLKSPRP
ncbi:MAG: PVC-type heme-binding CxxCH protein [Pirellulales bacterium]